MITVFAAFVPILRLSDFADPRLVVVGLLGAYALGLVTLARWGSRDTDRNHSRDTRR